MAGFRRRVADSRVLRLSWRHSKGKKAIIDSEILPASYWTVQCSGRPSVLIATIGTITALGAILVDISCLIYM